MRNLTLALLMVCLLAAPAEAKPWSKTKLYRTYHYSVALPLAFFCFIADAPVTIISHVNQHFDDKLKEAADAEMEAEMLLLKSDPGTIDIPLK